MELLATYQKTFQQEADAIGAKLVWEEKLNIHAYETPLTGVAAKHYESAVAKEGLTAAFEKPSAAATTTSSPSTASRASSSQHR